MSGSAVGSVLAPVSTCSETEVSHPPNDAATCWWLSVNFALFHKKRPELDAYFSDTTNVSSTGTVDKLIINKFKLTSKLKTNYENIYNHYTNTKAIDAESLIKYRVHDDMPAAFNVGGSDAFVINGSSNQPAEEYLLKLTEYIPFSGFIPPLVIKGDKEYNGQCYDLYIHKQYYGSTTEQFQLNNTNTDTVIISFKRKKDDGTFIQDEIKLLEKITLPLIDPASRTDAEKRDLDTSYRNTLKSDAKTKYADDKITEMVERRDYSYLRDIPITDKDTLKNNIKLETFSLDAIVEATGTHFNTYVKCGETGQWGFYNAISGGKINKDLTDFNKLPADLVKRATILFYTRVETAAAPTTSVALPAPLPGPPGSAAAPAGLPAPPSSALAVPAPLPEPPALAADADVPEPLPEPPALAAPAAADAAVPAAANAAVPAPLPEPPALAVPAAANADAAVPALLPEPPAPLPEPLVPPPPAAPPSAAPPPSLAAAAPKPPARS